MNDFVEKKDTVSLPLPITSQELFREISNLKELFQSHINRIDKSIEVAHEDLVRVPTEVQRAVGELKELHDSEFDGIQTQFTEREIRFRHVEEASKAAVASALAAQKELYAQQSASFKESTLKSEQQFTKQIDAIGELLRSEIKGLDSQISELKDRLNRNDGREGGTMSAKVDHRASQGTLIALIAVIASIVIGSVGIIIAVTKH